MGKILFLITVLSLYFLLRSVAKKNRVIPGDRKYIHIKDKELRTQFPANVEGSKEFNESVNITTRKDLMCW